MDVGELRMDLHRMIDKISDVNVLDALKTLLLSNELSQKDWWNTLSDDERLEIEKGLQEAEDREVIPHDEVMNKFKSWL